MTVNELLMRVGGGAHLALLDPDPEPPGPLAWHGRALCAQIDSDLFFPERGGATMPAKRVCMLCEVRTECLEEALRDDLQGVWGGTSERERQRMKGKRLPAA